MNSRRNFIRTSAVSVVSASFFPMNFSKSFRKGDSLSDDRLKLFRRFIAIDNVCAWPNLTVLNDGNIIPTIFNKPAHGKGGLLDKLFLLHLYHNTEKIS